MRPMWCRGGRKAQVLARDTNHAYQYAGYIFAGWLLLIGTLAAITLIRRITDTPAFLNALRIWSPLLREQIETPREWRRLQNHARLLAMRIRSEQWLPWHQRLHRWWHGQMWNMGRPVKLVTNDLDLLDEGLAAELFLMDYLTQGKSVKALREWIADWDQGKAPYDVKWHAEFEGEDLVKRLDPTLPKSRLHELDAAMAVRDHQVIKQLKVWLKFYDSMSVPGKAGEVVGNPAS